MTPERRVWSIAITVSLLLHGILFIFFPMVDEGKKEPEIMNIKLTMVRKPVQKAAEGQKGPSGPKKSDGKRKKEMSVMKSTPKPKVKSKPKVKPKQKKKIVKKQTPIKKEKIKKEFVKEISKQTVPNPIEENTVEVQQTTEPELESESTAISTLTGETSDVVENGGNDIYGTGGGKGNRGIGQGSTGNGTNLVDVMSLVVTKKIKPSYPAFSRKRNEEGTVIIVVTINSGKVTETVIEKSSGYSRLDNSAIKAVSQWEFDCTNKIKARIPVIFKLK